MNLYPDLQRRLSEVVQATLAPSISAVQLMGEQISRQSRDALAEFAAASTASIGLNLKIPPLSFDYESLFPKLISDALADQLTAPFLAFREFQRAQFTETFSNIGKMLEVLCPPQLAWDPATR